MNAFAHICLSLYLTQAYRYKAWLVPTVLSRSGHGRLFWRMIKQFIAHTREYVSSSFSLPLSHCFPACPRCRFTFDHLASLVAAPGGIPWEIDSKCPSLLFIVSSLLCIKPNNRRPCVCPATISLKAEMIKQMPRDPVGIPGAFCVSL